MMKLWMKKNGEFCLIVFGNCFQFLGICWMVEGREDRNDEELGKVWWSAMAH